MPSDRDSFLKQTFLDQQAKMPLACRNMTEVASILFHGFNHEAEAAYMRFKARRARHTLPYSLLLLVSVFVHSGRRIILNDWHHLEPLMMVNYLSAISILVWREKCPAVVEGTEVVLFVLRQIFVGLAGDSGINGWVATSSGRDALLNTGVSILNTCLFQVRVRQLFYIRVMAGLVQTLLVYHLPGRELNLVVVGAKVLMPQFLILCVGAYLEFEHRKAFLQSSDRPLKIRMAGGKAVSFLTGLLGAKESFTSAAAERETSCSSDGSQLVDNRRSHEFSDSRSSSLSRGRTSCSSERSTASEDASSNPLLEDSTFHDTSDGTVENSAAYQPASCSVVSNEPLGRQSGCHQVGWEEAHLLEVSCTELPVNCTGIMGDAEASGESRRISTPDPSCCVEVEESATFVAVHCHLQEEDPSSDFASRKSLPVNGDGAQQEAQMPLFDVPCEQPVNGMSDSEGVKMQLAASAHAWPLRSQRRAITCNVNMARKVPPQMHATPAVLVLEPAPDESNLVLQGHGDQAHRRLSLTLMATCNLSDARMPTELSAYSTRGDVACSLTHLENRDHRSSEAWEYGFSCVLKTDLVIDTPELVTLQLWDARTCVQVIPLLVLPETMRYEAWDLRGLSSSCDILRTRGFMSVELQRAHELIVDLAHWFRIEFLSTQKRSLGQKMDNARSALQPDSSALDDDMLTLGWLLLTKAVSNGWANLSQRILDGIMDTFDMSLRDLVTILGPDNHNLLHVAISSRKVYMAGLVSYWADACQVPLWFAEDTQGVTPMHLAVVNSDVVMIEAILKKVPAARFAWGSAQGGLRTTPAELAKSMGLVIAAHSSKARRSSSGGEAKVGRTSAGRAPGWKPSRLASFSSHDRN